ncbi:tripartite tricarboxylate transporter TctB family protein [Acidaminobacter hydrogenoformans]|uniref:Tripartite tricarboxylate transporter TctB family protein n=1 Tax=Acidaminobacter hydrogenoformans DSM 2784 TaxID=1120920 RepID=A0A1G5S850_9FIRM|nr:tripartite tricarboxylate transporter TctB family protein [Acidaminobacter hydrogenoformans]SCZ81799.1 Tripartite tricarboxylate transporter TctB family protein [Acidaminobacter hydrogenoformans DSM 2784]
MTLEIIFNAVLSIFFIYAYFYIGVNAPEEAPNQIDGIEWPRMILILLIVFMLINMYRLIKDSKKENSASFRLNVKELVKNKLFLGSSLMVIYSMVLEYTGFIVSSIILFGLYSYLLGEKRINRLIPVSILSVVVFYIIFSYGLDIMLPRGAGIFREFALMLESI